MTTLLEDGTCLFFGVLALHSLSSSLGVHACKNKRRSRCSFFLFCSLSSKFNESTSKDLLLLHRMKINDENKCIIFCKMGFYDILEGVASEKLFWGKAPRPIFTTALTLERVFLYMCDPFARIYGHASILSFLIGLLHISPNPAQPFIALNTHSASLL